MHRIEIGFRKFQWVRNAPFYRALTDVLQPSRRKVDNIRKRATGSRCLAVLERVRGAERRPLLHEPAPLFEQAT
jgi:hypothetical protein